MYHNIFGKESSNLNKSSYVYTRIYSLFNAQSKLLPPYRTLYLSSLADTWLFFRLILLQSVVARLVAVTRPPSRFVRGSSGGAVAVAVYPTSGGLPPSGRSQLFSSSTPISRPRIRRHPRNEQPRKPSAGVG